MRPVSLALTLAVIATPALAQDVTVLRGSSAPPPPQAALAPATVVIQREIIYQPMYLDAPGYVWVGAPIVRPGSRGVPPAIPGQSGVANGWPLISAGRR